METNALKITLWGKTVGFLSWDKQKKLSVFEYDTAFLEQDLDIAPLSMPLHSLHSQKGLPWMGDKDPLYQGLPPAIADSLPDKWGSSLFKTWLANQHISTKKVTPIDHLSFIGSRAMGALEYEPAQALGDTSAFSVDVQRLYAFARQVQEERRAVTLSAESSILWQDLIKISSSPGGKHPKAIVAISPETGAVVSGQGDIPDGFEHYILKYDDNSTYPYAKLEYIYYRMASDAGICMMPSELRSYGAVTHFLTRRFDRIGNQRIHTQTLAAMLPGSDSYEDAFSVIRRLNLPYEDREQQYLRLVFNVMACNVDDHSKNISFCMTPDGIWRLSPAYDLTFSLDLAAPAYMNRHFLTLGGKAEGIRRQDLLSVAEDNDIHNGKELLEKVAEALTRFDIYATEFDIDKALRKAIQSRFLYLCGKSVKYAR